MSDDVETTPQARIDAALARGDLARALSLSEAAVAESPGDVGLACKHAGVLRRAGRQDAALANLQAFDARHPDRVPILVTMATMARARGEPDRALALCDRVLERKPDHAGALTMRGEIALARHDLPTALAATEAARGHDTRNVALACRSAAILRRMGRLAEALAILDALDPDLQATLPARMERAGILRGMGDHGSATDLYGQVLAQNPGQKWAWAALVEIALASGEVDLALSRAQEALRHCPEEVLLASRHAMALHKAGRSEAALAALEVSEGARPDAVPVLMARGQILRDLGRDGEAAALFDRVLDADPAHPGATIARIDLGLRAGDTAGALRLGDTAVTLSPWNAALLAKRAAVLRRMGRHDEAEAQLTAHLEAHPDSLPAALALVATLREGGVHNRAAALLSRLTDRYPDHKGIRSERIALALQMAEIDTALALSAAAAARWPDDAALACRHATALRRAGRLAEARARLDALAESHPDAPAVLCARAEWHREAGEPAEAEALYRRALDAHPAHVQARQAAADLAAARGDVEAAIALLSGGRGTSGAGGTPSVPLDSLPPASQPSLVERLIAAEAHDRAVEAARGLVHRAEALTDGELARLIGLADRLGHPDVMAQAIRVAGQRDRMALPLVLSLLRLALVTERTDLALELEHVLMDRVHPATRFRAEVEAAMLLHGPFTARERLGRKPRPATLPPDAALVARVLMGGGAARLARRYLAFCLRRWPSEPALRSAFVEACIASAEPRIALDWLDRHTGQLSPAESEKLRLNPLLHEGERAPALDVVERQTRAGRRLPGTDQHLLLLMALGSLDGAEGEARRARSNAAIARQRAAHFGTSHVGALLNELRLYRAQRPADAAGRPDGDLVEANFHAAREVLDDWLRRAPQAALDGEPPADGSGPTRTILQYWNDPQPPAEIAEVMRSWQSLPGWRYLRLDRRGARRWLAETLGIDHARAFALARHVAEEADFLRLCLLWHEGGLYADADDLRTGPPEALIGDGARLLLFREPFGAIANNVIYAPPRHGAIGIAVRLARDALLRRDNDSVWLKTGPGLLTRAVAAWTLQAPESAAHDVETRRQVDLYRSVKPHVPLPYKRTARYWNRRASRLTDAEVIGALSGIARPSLASSEADRPA